MIDKIATSLPIQGRALDVPVAVPGGKGFAEELVAATKAEEVKTPIDETQNEKDKGRCGEENRESTSGSSFFPGQGG